MNCTIKAFLAISLLLLTPMFADYKKPNRRALYTQNLQAQQVTCSEIQVPSIYARPFKHKHQKQCGCAKECRVHCISQSDFDHRGKNGIIIDEPGEYRLKENIFFQPNHSNVQAITITSSNVILDLDIYTLQQANQVSGVYGVAIARDVHNVKITGEAEIAQIVDFTLAGIRVLGRTDQITLENVTVTQSEPRPLTNDVIPESCSELNCAQIVGGIYVGEGEPVGLAFNGTNKNNQVKNLVVNNVNALRCMFGAQIVMTFGMQIDNSMFAENTSNGLVLGNFLPIAGDEPNTFEFPVGSDGVVTNCRFDRNVGDNAGITNPTTGDVAGFFQFMSAIQINEVQNFTFENCSCDDNFSTTPILVSNHDGAHNIIWKNCTFNGNASTGGQCDGFHFSGSIPEGAGKCVGIGEQPFVQDDDVVVENCVSLNNHGFTSGTGFRFVFVNGGRISDCNASGNFGAGNGGFSSQGFGVEGAEPGGQSNAITFLRCTAERNGTEGFQAAGAGFAVRSDTFNVVFRDCVAVSNGNTAGTVSGQGSGFIINSTGGQPLTSITNNILFDNCVALSNGFSDQTGPSGGIVIRALTTRPPVSDVIVQNSTLAYNENGLIVSQDITGLVVKNNEADQNRLVGFNLAAVTSPKFVTKNIAYNNLVNNYTGVPPANIVTASSVNLPDGTTVGFKNLSVTP